MPHGGKTRFQRTSPTVWVLRLLPAGFLLLWAGLGALMLTRLVF